MDKKIALLKALNKDFFVLLNGNEDEVYFIGNQAEEQKKFDNECSEEYEEYFEECQNGDDQTAQIPVSLDEWKNDDDRTFFNYCDDYLEKVDEAVENETDSKQRETDYFKFENTRYFIGNDADCKKEYDSKSESDLLELHVYAETEKNSWLRGFCESNIKSLVQWYQRGMNENDVLGQNGMNGYEEVNGVHYTIYEQ